MLGSLIRFTVRNPMITLVVAAAAFAWGWSAWSNKSVDAIPDISENQVVVVARWAGHSPQDVEDQITHPLSTQLAGVRNVSEVRSLSGFGFSQIYVVFDEPLRLMPRSAVNDFYDARTRVLEKLASIQMDLPPGVIPELGPDATALGQIFMYTVDGPYDLATLRSLQDFVVRYELQAVSGVAEVSSVGGMLRQYQVDVDPDKLRHYGVGINEVVRAIRRANKDVGAKTIETGGAEHILRGLGFIKGIHDVEGVTVGFMTRQGFSPAAAMGGGMSMDAMAGAQGRAGTPRTDLELASHRPLLVRDLATVSLGPEFRRGALADARGERVGGIIAMRFGENPREVIERVRETITRLNDDASGVLPTGVKIVPFYDRTQLIEETVETLESALGAELWIAIIVVILFLLHVRSSLIIAATLPMAVMFAFVFMDLLGVDSNIMSLTGIAIAIGTMIDIGIVMTENIYRRLHEEGDSRDHVLIVEEAAIEIGPALFVAVATTIISFIPIFFLTDMEGKLFRPLVWTKTLALMMAALSGILIVPVLCRLFLIPNPGRSNWQKWGLAGVVALAAGVVAWRVEFWGLESWVRALLAGGVVFGLGVRAASERLVPFDENPVSSIIAKLYEPSLRWILNHKALFFMVPFGIVLVAIPVTLGAKRTLSPLTSAAGVDVDSIRPVAWLDEKLPGLGTEFMPPLDEGSLLYMPSLLPQASLSQTLEVMQRQNAMIESHPAVAKVVGKLGRADSALDPAPVGMIETVVILKPKELWAAGLMKQDIVNELMRLTHTPGVLEGAGAWIQPIETRVIMLNAGIRAPLAVKLIGSPRDATGRSLDSKDAVAELEKVANRIRDLIASVPGVAGPNVENLGGKPYVEFHVDRDRVGHYGLTVDDVQDTLTTAIGGMVIGRTVEGRESYTIRVAYERERRNRLEDLDRILVRGAGGSHVPLGLVTTISSVTGPAAVKTEDGLLRLHVTFAARGRDEGSVMRDVLKAIDEWRQNEITASRDDPVPAGVGIEAAGRFESQERARRRFGVLIPICFSIILFLLYLKFRSWAVCFNVFAALPVCIAGGLLLMAVFPHLKDVMFEMGFWDEPSSGPIYLTVAVVVGFIALAGIATDDGVVMATYLEQSMKNREVRGPKDIRDAVVAAGLRRIRPCLMTTFTTILALYPILASTGRGSDVAQPMAIPAVGGMLAELISLFIVPTVYCWIQEIRWRRQPC